MKIEIWSDFTCPFCYIGKRKLDLALEQFDKKQYVNIEYKSYQLDPNAKSENRETVYSMLMEKYKLSSGKTREMTGQICEQAEQVGLTFHFDNLEHTNTFHAHRLVKYAEKCQKELDLVNLLFYQYFTLNRNIGNRDVLLALAKELGFDEDEVDELLSLNCYAKAVDHDIDLAREIGVNGVPFFIFNEKYAISGAQPTDVFLNVLDQLWQEEKDAILTRAEKGKTCKSSYCIGNDCES